MNKPLRITGTEQWAQKSPWQPVVKQKNGAGKWEEVPTQRLYDAKLDPELRVFARSSSDDKGPIFMFLAAMDALKAANIDPKAAGIGAEINQTSQQQAQAAAQAAAASQTRSRNATLSRRH